MKKTTKTFSKGLALILVLVLAFTMMPMSVFAEGENTKTVYITISDAGQIQLAKDNITGMARIPIEVPSDAKLDQVIHKVHVDYHENGEAGYSEASGFYSKFWGKETYNIGYFLNGKMTDTANTTEINNNDEVDAFIYKNYKTDLYSKFDKRYTTVAAGENLTLTLTGHGIFDTAFEPIEGAKLLLDDGTMGIPCDDSNNFITDKNGDILISFPKAGKYSISAQMPDSSFFAITAPICQVEVTGENLSEETMAAKAQKDADSIILSGVTGDNVNSDIDEIKLPEIGGINHSKITWKSSNPSVITDEGKIIRTTSVGNATLTATINYWGKEIIKEFSLQVPAISESEINGMIDEIAVDFTVDKLTPVEFSGAAYGYYPKEGSAVVDTNLLTKAQAVADAEKLGSTISLISDNSAIANDGSITYGEESVSGEVEFTIEMLGTLRSIILNIEVPSHAITKAEVLQGDWLDFNSIRSQNTSDSSIKTDLVLPKEDSNGYYTEIEWASNNADVIQISNYAVNNKFTGKVVRPVLGQPDAQIVLTAKIKPGIYWEYGMAPAGPMPDPAYNEKTFTLKVPAVTAEEQENAQALVNEAIELFDLNNIILRDTNNKADLQSLTYSFNGIPYNWNYVDDLEGFKEEYRVIDVAWSSENPGIDEISTGADVTRTEIDQTGDIVLTLSYNGAEATKRFPAVVKAFTEQDAENENAILQEAADSLTFDVIRGDNVIASEITANLVRKQAAIKSENEITFENSTKYHHEGANISWASDNTNVINNLFKVTRPAQNTEVKLTATFTSPKFANCLGVLPIEKTFSVTVLGTGEKSLITGIAENYASKDVNWWSDEGKWWHAVAMNAYKNSMNDTTNVVSNDAVQAFVNKTISEIAGLDMAVSNASSNTNKLANAINGMSAFGFDPASLWTVNHTKIDAVNTLKSIKIEDAKKGWYSTIAPYVITAYNQGTYDTEAQEEAHIEYLISELGKTDWSWGVDIPAMILQGLIPYYDRVNVKSAVDEAINTISNEQKENGSFGNSNSDATVIIALSELGINVDNDPRFIKNGNSLLDGLLSYKVPTNNGFATTVGGEYDDTATYQGFIALISAQKVISTGQAYNPFDFMEIQKVQAYANGTGNSDSNPLPPPTGEKDIKVSFTLKSDSDTWISRTTVTLKENATVYHVIKKVLDEKNYNYESVNNSYISSITNPSGTTLAEFTKGVNSGWLYKVNGELPNKGLKDYNLSDGDDIVLYYTADWTKDPDAGDITNSGGPGGNTGGIIGDVPSKDNAIASITVEVSTDKNGNAQVSVQEKVIIAAIENIVKEENKELQKEVQVEIQADSKATTVETTLPKAVIAELNKKIDVLTIKTPLANISLDSQTLAGLKKDMADDVKITASKVNIEKNEKISEEAKIEIKKEIGDRPVFDFTILTGDKKVSNFAGQVSVSVPYTPAENENLNNIIIYYVNDSGKLEIVKDCAYDEKTKTIKFATNHFSNYAVGYKEVSFDDIKTHWAKDNIAFLGARKIIKGKTKKVFDPNSNITRAEFVQILANISGTDLSKYSVSNFGDVKAGAWYAKATIWAEKTGVVYGTKRADGSIVFKPNDNISRQDMAVMISRYMKNIEGKEFKVTAKEIKFRDQDKIRNYANTAVTELQKAGIINGVKNGDGSTNFYPANNATRAESATMTVNLIQKKLVL